MQFWYEGVLCIRVICTDGKCSELCVVVKLAGFVEVGEYADSALMRCVSLACELFWFNG